MIEQTKSALRWVKGQYRRASPLVKIVYGLLLVALLTLVGVLTPFFTEFRSLFAQASPFAQSAIMIFLFVACSYSLIAQWERSTRVEQFRSEIKGLESGLRSAVQELESKKRVVSRLCVDGCRIHP